MRNPRIFQSFQNSFYFFVGYLNFYSDSNPIKLALRGSFGTSDYETDIGAVTEHSEFGENMKSTPYTTFQTACDRLSNIAKRNSFPFCSKIKI